MSLKINSILPNTIAGRTGKNIYFIGTIKVMNGGIY